MTPSDSAFAHLRLDAAPSGVCTITLDRPDRLNAVNARLADELPQAVQQAAGDDAARVIVITGAGRGFCAGLDLGEPVHPGTSRHEQLDPYHWVGRWVQAITHCEKPVLAAINGACAGAGFGLALACDLRVMSRSAVLTAGYVRRGLSPDAGVSWFLPRLIGLARAADVILTGRDVRAEEAERIGLVSAVHDDEQFSDAVQRYAAQLAAGPPLAFAHTKRLLLGGLESSLDAQLREEFARIKLCFGSEDVAEAMHAFREKRAPVFRGR
jgi:2-(1,2-epoxy-1,2-dihydrophenyl)acetyl-CoA isomerase